MKTTTLRPNSGPSPLTAPTQADPAKAIAAKPATQRPFASDAHGARPLAPDARPEVGAAASAAAAANLQSALEGALGARASGRSGPLQARLKAAGSALAALEQSVARPPLNAALAKAQALAKGDGPEAAQAAGLVSQIVKLERQRLLDEICTVSPTPRARLEALIDNTPDPEKLVATLATQYPGVEALGETKASLRAALTADLGDELREDLRAAMETHGVAPDQVDGFYDMMAETRAAFGAGFSAESLSGADRDMQRTGWVHTRIEVAKAAVAFARRVPPSEGSDQRLMSTLMGALTSDSFKDASLHSLLWHNRGGAELVLPLIASRNLPSETVQDSLPVAMKLAHEHQITPAMFMAGAMRGLLGGAKVDPDVIEEIAGKIGDPLGAPAKGGEIVFSAAAQAALDSVGIPGWATMDPNSAHFVESQTVALADVLQYVAPDGIIKIAVDIRDPEQPAAFMRDTNVRAAVDSSVGFSFAKGMEAIVDDDLQKYGQIMSESVRAMLDYEVYPEVERRLANALAVPDGGALPEVPYWNKDVSTEGDLTDAERASIKLVKSTLRDALARAGGVELNPFGQEDKR